MYTVYIAPKFPEKYDCASEFIYIKCEYIYINVDIYFIYQGNIKKSINSCIQTRI